MRKGFTLIEILIVVAIIAILASIVLVGLGPTQQAGRDARRLSDLREVQNGLELYFQKCGFYPGPTVSGSCAGQSYSAISTWAGSSGLTGVLEGSALGISVVPTDPSSGRNYFYAASAGGTTYIIGAQLENINNSVFNNYVPPAIPANQTTDSGVTFNCTSASGQYCLSL